MNSTTLIPGFHLLVSSYANSGAGSKTARPRKFLGVTLRRPIRSAKVLRIKRQLKNGSYDLDERLDAVLENILKDIKD